MGTFGWRKNGAMCSVPDCEKSPIAREWCRPHYNQWWNAQNPERYKDILSRHTQKTKRVAIEAYGGQCACCGEPELAFLCIDHINGGGEGHREEVGGGGRTMYIWLREQGWPDGFQVLCHNCNFAKSAYGKCPHV